MRYLITILLLLSASTCWGVVLIQSSGDTSGSCDTQIFSETAGETNTYPIANNSTSLWLASMFTASATGTVCGADVYLKETVDLSASGITMTMAIYSNSCSTCDRTDDEPGSIVTADSESDAFAWSDVDDGGVTTAYSFTGMSASITSGNLYWIVFEPTNYNVTAYPSASGTNAAVTEEIKDAPDGSTWGLVSATRSFRFTLYE